MMSMEQAVKAMIEPMGKTLANVVNVVQIPGMTMSFYILFDDSTYATMHAGAGSH